MKHILFVQSHPPHGTLFGQEGLDAILMGSAFTSCSVLFTGDGIYQILKNQHPQPLESKDYSRSYQALSDYGVESIYCLKTDLEHRGLTSSDLMIGVMELDHQGARNLLSESDVILDF